MPSVTPDLGDRASKVVISSTLLDLEAHREQATLAVIKAKMTPVLMERDEGPIDATPTNYSLSLVDESGVYVGIFGFRYGDPPPGKTRSLTEQEYRYAVERNLSIYIFIMHDDHDIKARDVETDPGKRARLAELKKELTEKHKVGVFTSPEHLHTLVYETLLEHSVRSRSRGDQPVAMLIPKPPEPYLPHRYGLSRAFFGREKELGYIDTWATSEDPCLVIRSLGGVGKTALSWRWIMERSHQIDPPFDGIMWWSFYDPESTVSSFIAHALAYVSHRPLSEVENMKPFEREATLLTYLSKSRFLIVLDGLERILNAFHIMSGTQIPDEELEQRLQFADSRLRAFTDERDGRFLRELATIEHSKILITTRLMPLDLEAVATGRPVSGVRLYPLGGLEPEDALAFTRSLGVFGAEAAIRSFLGTFEYHPLVITLVAGLVNKSHPPYNFDKWFWNQARNFKLSKENLVQRRSDILHYALLGLAANENKLLSYIAAFGDRVAFTTLQDIYPLLMEREERPQDNGKHSAIVGHSLDAMLRELEERGLIERDIEHDQYDMHPVVRTHAFQQLQVTEQKQLYSDMVAYFERIGVQPRKIVKDRGELREIILFYRALVGCGQHDKGAVFFNANLWSHLFYELADYYTIVELLTPLFPRGFDAPPSLTSPNHQSQLLEQIASVFSVIGDQERALNLRIQKLSIDAIRRDLNELVVGLANLVNVFEDANRLALSSRTAVLAEKVANVIDDAYCNAICDLRFIQLYVDMNLAQQAVDSYNEFVRHMARMKRNLPSHAETVLEVHAELELARLDIRLGSDPSKRLARATDLATRSNYLLGSMNALWLQAECALTFNKDYKMAESLLERANMIAFKSQLSVTGYYTSLARVRVCEKFYDKARELINVSCTHGEPSLGIADVCYEMGDRTLAVKYSQMAYQEAWGEGHPYSKNWELAQAERILNNLQVPIPRLSAFNVTNASLVPCEREILRLVGAYGGNKVMPEKPLLP